MVNDDNPPSILAKAFALLQVFGPEQRVMSLSEIGRAAGLPKSTVHRLLARLIELGAIEHHRSGYRIGIAMLQIGATAPAMGLREVASPFLAALHHRTGLTVHLAVLRQFDVVVLERITRRSLPLTGAGVGSRLPANCTALGKVLLAHEDLDDLEMFLPRPMPALTAASVTDVDRLAAELHDIHRSGSAREAHQARPGMACIASPIVVMGSAVAAMSVAFHAGAQPGPGLETAVRNTAARIAGNVWTALRDGRVDWFPHEIDEYPQAARPPVGRTLRPRAGPSARGSAAGSRAAEPGR